VSGWAALMTIAGGLFAGGAATFAWSRVPIWRRMPSSAFVGDFAETLSRTDKVQPALLVLAILSAVAYAVTANGTESVLAVIAAAGFALTLALSVTVMVPLQRRIISAPDPESIGEMRERWYRGHLGRATLSVAAFAVAAVAAVG